MTSWKSVLLFLIPFLLIFFASPSSFVTSYSLDVQDGLSKNAAKVNLSVYYEALCPSCADFIVRNLMTIFNNGLIDIINLRMIPWGNAHVNRVNNTMVCQNGLDECELNTIQACAINVWNNVNKYYALIYCIEFLAIEGRHRNWLTCFSSLGLSKKPVMECYKNGNGTKLDVVYGYETTHLKPPQTFVPWVLVNNQPLGTDYKNFTAYVCNAYKGDPVPTACIMPKISSVKGANPVCYRGIEAMSMTSLRPKKRLSRSRKSFHKDPSDGFTG
ncbi:Gamma-interferon-inducible lysosomal thiol reductase precursor, putative [Ricinus communis]|uniref:Gamma-interferon-inducible lysosomal thiol reductase, putative n=1 Tax=Ricinus communis TaxID=3988 RepID=B9SKZ4_RICCO|nr:Gamma-interferon-inducible lysosomal thiol reductase precursor, putative [Ricinus communis]|eukprot:XP_002526663.1 gamma-interferon-inducible lysosomal thiol reductase [Ricinus communis]